MDQRALKILFDRHWSSQGWKHAFETPDDDFEYAVAAGVMFSDVVLSHDEVVEWLTRVRDAANLDDIVDGFLASLRARTLAPRSALGSYAFARHFPRHEWIGSDYRCAVCGLTKKPSRHDLSVLNFERHKWGGVRHDDPVYAAFDLVQFVRTDRPPVQADDVATFEAILRMIQGLNPAARPSAIEHGMSKVLRSNKSEREILIDILGLCGVLEPELHPSYLSGFVNHADRAIRNSELKYPACWWRGSDGVNARAVNYYFGRAFNRTLSHLA
jgi:hypothetical protein